MTGSSLKKERSNYSAGFYTIIAVLLGFTVTLAVIRHNLNDVEGTDYTLTFTMQSGVGSLQTGSSITSAGITIGQINSIRIQDGQLKAEIFIKDPYTLYPEAIIYREDSMMGGADSLTISSFGDSGKSPLEDGDVITASPQPATINGLLGDRDASRIDAIQTNADELTKGIREIGRTMRENQDLVMLSEDFRGMMADSSEDIALWKPRLDDIQGRISRFEAQFPALRLEMDTLNEASSTTRQSILELRERIGPESRASLSDAVERLIQDADAVSKKIEDEVLPRVRSIIDQAEFAWSDLQSIEGRLKSMASDARRTLQVAVANSALAAQQLALAQKEIIDSLGIPLIETPSLEDQRLEMRIEILDQWARSATQLRRFLGVLEMYKGDSSNINDDVLLERLIDSLNAALVDFEHAQSKLVSIKGSQKTPTADIDEADVENR